MVTVHKNPLLEKNTKGEEQFICALCSSPVLTLCGTTSLVLPGAFSLPMLTALIWF
jgi:hypothetical protein